MRTSRALRWYGSGPAKRMVEVEWNDTWEPVQGCREYSNFQALYNDFQTTRNAPPKRNGALPQDKTCT
jgi:hypothetical protein